jgi:catechol 2,3-dioxygenase-like lactoylglutathione lyase family enzyme
MAFNHVAFATRDLAATHAFYTEVMGFRLAKVVAAPTDSPGGWARHVFYDTGDGAGGKGLIAFWDLHDDAIGDRFPTDLSRSLGLPAWVNHVAFDAPTLDDLAAHTERWREHGHTVAEVDHGFCVSIYITDPNGILVEFCCDTRPLDSSDAAEAEALLAVERPPLSEVPRVKLHRPHAPVA